MTCWWRGDDDELRRALRRMDYHEDGSNDKEKVVLRCVRCQNERIPCQERRIYCNDCQVAQWCSEKK